MICYNLRDKEMSAINSYRFPANRQALAFMILPQRQDFFLRTEQNWLLYSERRTL